MHTPRNPLLSLLARRDAHRRTRVALLCALWLAASSAPAGADEPWPTAGWSTATAAEMQMDASLLEQARAIALAGGGSGMVVRHGRQVMVWGDPDLRYDLKSTTKSIGVTALGLALGDGLVGLGDSAQLHFPAMGALPESNLATGWLDEITLFHLATHSAGFDKPGGEIDLLFEPGSTWAYSDGGANWLPDVLTTIYVRDLHDLLFERVFTPMGLDSSDLRWRNNLYRSHTLGGVARREFGSGITANVDAMARIGYLYLNGGEWEGAQLLPSSFVAQVVASPLAIRGLPVHLPDDYPGASDHYGLLWWNNADASIAGVPTDAFWSWGLRESLIVVMPSLGLVAARAGSGWRSGWDGDYAVITPFLQALAGSAAGGGAPPTVAVPAASTWAQAALLGLLAGLGGVLVGRKHA